MEGEKSILLSSATEEKNENAAVVAAATTSSSSTCECPNGCKPFLFLPTQQGIMITLQRQQQQRHHRHHHYHSAAAAMSNSTESLVTMDGDVPGNTTNATINANSTLLPTQATTTSSTCRLEIHPQKDANLIQFHPNIYIPEVLLEYPDHLIKYGGGGSGVTVFGGYHPLLGSLVMKHGGHSDLIELVSLAKIEREIDVRSKWKIDRLILDSQQQQKQKQLQQRHERQQQQEQERRSTSATGMRQFGSMFSVAHFLKPSSSSLTTPTQHKQQFQDDNAKADKQIRKTIFKPSSRSPTFSSRYHHQSDSLGETQRKNDRKSIFEKFTAAHFLKPSTSSSSVSRQLDGDDSSNLSHFKAEDSFDVHHRQQRQCNDEKIRAIHQAVEDMIRRIPSFRMIYISPMHVRERAEELKNRSFTSSSIMMMNRMQNLGNPPMDLRQWKEHLLSSAALSPLPEKETGEDAAAAAENGFMDGGGTKLSAQKISPIIPSASLQRSRQPTSSVPLSRMGRELHLFGSPLTKNSSIHVKHDHVDICFGGDYYCWEVESQAIKEEDDVDDTKATHQQQRETGSDGRDGYASLTAFVDHLRQQQELNEWKITLAQEKIGISSNDDKDQLTSRTASYFLAKGMLHGPLLHHLIDSEIQVIRNLQLLTLPEELNVVDKVRAEYEAIVSYQQKENCKVSASYVSKLANNFVGRAIHKNFDPVKGRFLMLRQFGIDLRSKHVHLQPNEIVPAKHLENLFCHLNLEQRAVGSEGNQGISGHELMDSTFDMNNYSDHLSETTSPQDKNHPIFASGLDQWQSLLELSISMKHPNATQRIWTCGLTDGGLHNMFLSEDYLWLFDLGEPTLEPIPAFVTKFLMSFFHTLGMEEDENGDWIVRFEQDDTGKLSLTKETKDILPTVIRAFNTTLDRLINELFGGEEEIRVLLLRYVVTQLISDCAFCIEKWRIKGGGDELRSEHQNNVEKWLWRALWDVYASEEIRRRYLTRMLFRRQFESRDLSSMDLETM